MIRDRVSARQKVVVAVVLALRSTAMARHPRATGRLERSASAGRTEETYGWVPSVHVSAPRR